MNDRFEVFETPITGLTVLRRKPIGDSRGYLERMFCASELEFLIPGATGIAQINHTVTPNRGTLRGLHFQYPPHAEGKLVSCLQGEVFNASWSIPRGSPTFLRWHAEVLSAENHRSMFIPERFRSWISALFGAAWMLYFHTVFHAPDAESWAERTGSRARYPMAHCNDGAFTSRRGAPVDWPGVRRSGRMNCRYCASTMSLPLVDASSAAECLSGESEITEWFPLRVLVCEKCWLVQTEDFARADELFDAGYAYFSAFSSTWLAHCERYVGEMTERFGLHAGSHVVEVAANDGYLLQYVKARGIGCTGVEPTAAAATAARARGISVVQDFFGARLAWELASQGKLADLMVANNVLAHVPDINDFVAGFALLLKPAGVATFEFPHLVNLIGQNQFDTIYHEHFSYLSLRAVRTIFAAHGLDIFDVETHPTHGGSLRVFVQRGDTKSHPVSARVDELLQCEERSGVANRACYEASRAGRKNQERPSRFSS